MKANEIEDGKILMIGDLVVGCIETDIVGEATYKILCKVTDINHYGDVSCEALKPFPDELDWQDGDDFSWIEPIPLTAEILEKNEFEKQQFGHFIYENDDVNLRIEFYPKNINYTNGCYDYIDIEKGCVTITEMPIEFVHELQHALRLCGITREIIL